MSGEIGWEGGCSSKHLSDPALPPQKSIFEMGFSLESNSDFVSFA